MLEHSEYEPTDDERRGLEWWNGLSEARRRFWIRESGGTGRVVDAWKCCKRMSAALRSGAYDFDGELPVFDSSLDLPREAVDWEPKE